MTEYENELGDMIGNIFGLVSKDKSIGEWLNGEENKEDSGNTKSEFGM